MKRLEAWLIVLIALHSYAIGIAMLFFTEPGVRFGGWQQVFPLFFVRQAGIFHIVVATGYLIEYRKSRTVDLLIFAKTVAFVFLITHAIIAGSPSVVWLSGIADGLMAILVLWIRRKARR
jgi:hypothetical protein